MKKLFFMIAIMLVAMSGRSFAQSSIQNRESEIIFLMQEEPYCLIHFDFISLADIIAQSDTIVSGKEETFSITMLTTHDDDIKIIVIEEYDNELKVRMFTQTSCWVEYYEDTEDGSYPKEIEDLIAMALYIRHQNEVYSE